MTVPNLEAINPQVIKPGFGGYLSGILPPDVATACGALSASLLQVRNIKNVPLPQLAQAVINLETMRGLAVNGTSVPTNVGLATDGHNIMALGCGPQGTYTASDFFGCMSGLPYLKDYKTTQQLLQRLETPYLKKIYEQMYLSVTWDNAAIGVTTSTTAVPDGAGGYNYYYQVTGVNVSAPGGGYSRGDAPPPIITIGGGSGATATVTNWNVTLDPSDHTTFGRINGVQLTTPGSLVLYGNGASPIPPVAPTITADIESPPQGAVVPAPPLPTGLSNSPPNSFPTNINPITQIYIDEANREIGIIMANNPELAALLNNSWNAIGTQLKREQRARNTAFYPLPSPKSPLQPLSLSPTTIITWVDSVPVYAQDTRPHMYAQTIEAISNWGTTGGQSIVGLMRQERNTTRLLQAGIPLDNTVPVTDQTINLTEDKTLIGNGSNGSAPGSNNPSTPLIPAVLQISDDVVIDPIGYYDPITDQYMVTNTEYGNDAVDIGRPMVPGSFAGSEYLDLISPNLNTLLTSAVLIPATYTVDEAITEVEKCNCDCWDQ